MKNTENLSMVSKNSFPEKNQSTTLRKRPTFLARICLAALLCVPYATTVLGQAVTASFAGGYSQAEKDAVLRAVAYWNEIITSNGFVPNTTMYYYTGTIEFLKDNIPAGSAWGGIPQIAFSLNTTWDTGRNSQIKNGIYNMESVAIHELAHSLGILGAYDIDVPNSKVKLYYYAPPNQGYLPAGTWYDFFYVNGTKAQLDNWYNTTDNFTFNGANAMKIWGDGASKIPVPILNGTKEGSSYVHPIVPTFGNMNQSYSGATRPFFTEVELAIMMDLGHTIDLKHFFGRSIYQTHAGTIVNTDGFDRTSTYGIGLHILSGNNTIEQSAHLISNGWAGAGIRIENKNNVVKINDSFRVAANGEQGVGVLITHGAGSDYYGQDPTNATLINQGAIEARGVDGRGVWFNAGANTFDNSGKIDARRTSDGGLNKAIHIGNKAPVSAIHLMRGTDITGHIVSDHSSQTTLLTFGQSASGNGTASGSSDSGSFVMSVTGDISGRFALQTWGGTTTSDGNITALSAIVGMGTAKSTLALVGNSNTFSAGLTVNSNGTLRFGNGGSMGHYAGAINSNGGTIAFNRSDTVIFNHSINGTANLVQAGPGTLVVNSNRTNILGTTVEAGTLRFDDGGKVSGNLVNYGNVTINRSSGSITLSDVVAGVLSGAGTLTKQGSGTLTLSGNPLYTGGTIVNAGMLQITSAVTNVGDVFLNAGTVSNGGFINQLTYAGGTFNNLGGSIGTLVAANDVTGMAWGIVGCLAFDVGGTGSYSIAASTSSFIGISMSIDFAYGNIVLDLSTLINSESDCASLLLDLASLFGVSDVAGIADLNSFKVLWGNEELTIVNNGLFSSGWGAAAGGFVSAPVPEPATLAFLWLSLASLARRRRK
jgi:autotransporter-associated beta strand protein